MEISKLLLEGYLVFGIILTYTIAIIIGIIIGEKQSEKEYNYGKQVQSKEKEPFNGTKFTFME